MWKKMNYERQGRGHEKDNIPCQDKTITKLKKGVNCIALADGAGSAKFSHIGAEAVTNFITELLCEKFDRLFLCEDHEVAKNHVVYYILKELERVSKLEGCNIEDLASTLLVIAVKDEKYIGIHIGDGVIGYVRDNEIYVGSKPYNGQFSNQTVFTSSRSVRDNIRLMKGNLDGITSFVLMSDGTGASLYSKKDNYISTAVNKLFECLKEERMSTMYEMIDNTFKEYICKRTLDDCSICMMIKIDEAGKVFRSLPYEVKCCELGLSTGDYLRKRKQLNRYADILDFTSEPKEITAISRKLDLKEKYTKRILDKLVEKEFVEVDERKYYTVEK